MKIDKVIMSCDDSHYQYYWPVVAKVCKKILKATPVLFKISQEDSELYFDGNGLVKNVKAVEGVDTGIQSLFYRIYGTKFFPDEVCLISDIDMMLLSEEYFQGSIKDFDDDSFVVYTSDAYDLDRDDSKNLFETNVYGMCYNAAKGKVFEDILDLNGSFEDFVGRLRNYNIERGLEWYGDEVYLTNRVNLFSEKYKIHLLRRGVQEGFKVVDRIEKWQFPVKFEIEQMRLDNLRDGNYDVHKLKNGFYLDCHCIRPYGWYEKEINEVAEIACSKDKIFETISGQDYSKVNDRCFTHEGDIVDIGCLNWDWSEIFVGKKRIVGVDPFEKQIPFTEIFTGVIDVYDGETKMANQGIASTIINQEDGEIVKVKTWKNFKKEYNIDKISILKLNIEGAEYDLLDSFEEEDFESIDQIAVSFHDWMVPEWKPKTERALNILRKHNFYVEKINQDWGWYLATKKYDEPVKKNKVALISSFCDTEQKQNILKENIIKVKGLGIDVIVISPIRIPQEIVDLCDYFFYTKDNPLLKWPIRMYTHWYEMRLADGRITTLQRGLADYGWAGLYQVKKLSQIGLTFDYDIFYHMIYDLEIDEVVEEEFLSNNVNIIHPRRDPHHPDTLWETTLHFMVFDKEMMVKIEKEITLENYLSTNGMAEGEVLKWKNKYNLPTSPHPVKDKIFYWGDYDFFNYSPFSEFKMFISKNEKMNIWLGESPVYQTELTDNLRICFHSFDNVEEIKVEIDGTEFVQKPKNWEIVEFPLSSQKIESLIFTYKNKVVNFSEQYKDIMMNQVYYNHRP